MNSSSKINPNADLHTDRECTSRYKYPMTMRERNEERERYLKSTSGEFDANGGLGLQTKLIPSESGKEVGFSNAGVAD